MPKTRYGSLSILGHSLRNIIPLVGNHGESEVGSGLCITSLNSHFARI